MISFHLGNIRNLVSNGLESLQRCVPDQRTVVKKGVWGRWKSPAIVDKFIIPSRDYHILGSMLAQILFEVDRVEKEHNTEVEELEEVIDGREKASQDSP